jgi:hypothetical protein
LPFSIRLRILPPIPFPTSDPPEVVRDHIVSTMQQAMDEMSRVAT